MPSKSQVRRLRRLLVASRQITMPDKFKVRLTVELSDEPWFNQPQRWTVVQSSDPTIELGLYRVDFQK